MAPTQHVDFKSLKARTDFRTWDQSHSIPQGPVTYSVVNDAAHAVYATATEALAETAPGASTPAIRCAVEAHQFDAAFEIGFAYAAEETGRDAAAVKMVLATTLDVMARNESDPQLEGIYLARSGQLRWEAHQDEQGHAAAPAAA